MRLRSRKMTSILLAASLVFSLNTAAFAEEAYDAEELYEASAEAVLESNEEPETVVEEDGEEAAGEETAVETEAAADEAEDTAETEAAEAVLASETPVSLASDIDAQKALSGNVTLASETPDLNVSENGTVSVDDIVEAVVENLTFTIDSKTYYVDKYHYGYLRDYSTDKIISKDFTYDSVSVNLTKIRKAGSSSTSDVGYTDASKSFVVAKGNQILTYTATINNKVIPGAKSNTITGELLLKTPWSGAVSWDRVTFGTDNKYAIVVEYDACVEYRGTKVTATSHYLASSSENSSPVNGEVDAALGVAARLEKKDASGNWLPLDGKYFDNYFWQGDNGITLKKPKIYNAKKVGAYYDDGAPYFKITMTYKKKSTDSILSLSDKAALKTALANHKFTFTIEPRKLSTDLMTYKKTVGEKYYVKNLKYSSTKNTLKGSVRYRTYKKTKSTLNVRKLTNTGKNMKFVTKSTYESGGGSKADAYFVYTPEDGGITINGMNGYYGSALITNNFKVV